MLKIGAVRTKFNEIMFKRIWPILRTFEQTRQHVLKLKCQRTVGVAALSSQNAGNVNLHGVFPPIPTPFNADESIAYDALEHNLQIWNTIPFTGYLVQGSNGEYTLMNAAERVDMVRRVRALVPKDKVIMAGAGCESTAATVAMARDMSAAGADCVMVVTPSYYRGRMTSQALYEHFARVADGSPAPVVLYSVPANTNIDLAVEVVVRLAEHDNVIGLKDSGGEVCGSRGGVRAAVRGLFLHRDTVTAARRTNTMWSPTHAQVTVQQAQNLPKKRQGGAPDTFVLIQLGQERFRTSVQHRTTCPVWGEEADILLPSTNDSHLQLTVYQRCFLRPDRTLGYVTVPLANFNQYHRPRSTWYNLKSKSGKADDKVKGQLQIKLSFLVKNKNNTIKRSTSIRSVAQNLGDRIRIPVLLRSNSLKDCENYSSLVENLVKQVDTSPQRGSQSPARVRFTSGDTDDASSPEETLRSEPPASPQWDRVSGDVPSSRVDSTLTDTSGSEDGRLATHTPAWRGLHTGLRRSWSAGPADITHVRPDLAVGVDVPPENISLPPELIEKFSDLSREQLIHIVFQQQLVIQKKDLVNKDLEDYIDNLLVKVMETTPKLLQSSYSDVTEDHYHHLPRRQAVRCTASYQRLRAALRVTARGDAEHSG